MRTNCSNASIQLFFMIETSLKRERERERKKHYIMAWPCNRFGPICDTLWNAMEFHAEKAIAAAAAAAVSTDSNNHIRFTYASIDAGLFWMNEWMNVEKRARNFTQNNFCWLGLTVLTWSLVFAVAALKCSHLVHTHSSSYNFNSSLLWFNV